MLRIVETAAFARHMELEFPSGGSPPELEDLLADLLFADGTIAGWSTQDFRQDENDRDFFTALEMIDELNDKIGSAYGPIPAEQAVTLYRYTASLLAIALEARRNSDLAITPVPEQ
ncbi:MAG: hypothetical protein Q7T75_05665 [Mesorhizobium sp.]|nr:hypothetical protein [Mesorhizobium sp.]